MVSSSRSITSLIFSRPSSWLPATRTLRIDGFSLTANVRVSPPDVLTSASTLTSAKKPIFHIARMSSRIFAASNSAPGFDSSWTRIASSSTLRLPRNCTRSIGRPCISGPTDGAGGAGVGAAGAAGEAGGVAGGVAGARPGCALAWAMKPAPIAHDRTTLRDRFTVPLLRRLAGRARERRRGFPTATAPADDLPRSSDLRRSCASCAAAAPRGRGCA